MTSNAELQAAASPASDDQVQVLLVEDDDGDALLVGELLREVGAAVVVRRASPDQVNELEEELKAQGKPYEFQTYEGAGHAFFAVNRAAYRPEAAVDGWEKIFTWFGRYLA